VNARQPCTVQTSRTDGTWMRMCMPDSHVPYGPQGQMEDEWECVCPTATYRTDLKDRWNMNENVNALQPRTVRSSRTDGRWNMNVYAWQLYNTIQTARILLTDITFQLNNKTPGIISWRLRRLITFEILNRSRKRFVFNNLYQLLTFLQSPTYKLYFFLRVANDLCISDVNKHSF